MRLNRFINRILIPYGLVTVCAVALLTWLMGEIGRAREEARSSQCVGNLKQLGLALLNYESAYGCLPPPYVVDARGKPLYSWRVVLWAYLERERWNDRQLTEKFRFGEPWDSPRNRSLHSMRPPNFFCPSHPDRAERGLTSFVAVVGPRTLFPGGGQVRRLAEVRDDPDATLMLVESQDSGIHWMEPRDLDWDLMSFRVNDRSRPGISSGHGIGSYPGPHVLTADYGVATLSDTMSPDSIKALLMIDDGERVELEFGPRRN
ncbi:DUF1559 family PulG-like putative transporter [Paludisphaera soli]|uniref:DUF1559 family PulG-like putative transporter n=1 Tax=Paludisphaera soli TaxID=2712865 RepID=UPI0013ED98C2|nr:DUF1559 domain-containing protein [Paludisphaera soli]